jgi:hypothetical protein
MIERREEGDGEEKSCCVGERRGDGEEGEEVKKRGGGRGDDESEIGKVGRVELSLAVPVPVPVPVSPVGTVGTIP